jgi:hypothetical protein
MYPDDNSPMGGMFTTEHAAAVIVIGSLVFLILVRKGFRGLSVPGVGGAVIG